MDLQKEISLGGKNKGKKIAYPTKTSINLMKAEVTRGNTAANIGLFLIFLVLLALFAKFAVVDPLSSGIRSSQELEAAEAELSALTAENQSYTELAEQYARYVVTGLTDEERNLADRDELIDLLSSTVLGATHLSSIKVVGNAVTVTCIGVGLQDVSGIVQELEQDSRVEYVTVSTAQEKDNVASSATFQIELKGALSADAAGSGGAGESQETSSGSDAAAAKSDADSGGGLGAALGVPSSNKGGSNE